LKKTTFIKEVYYYEHPLCTFLE